MRVCRKCLGTRKIMIHMMVPLQYQTRGALPFVIDIEVSCACTWVDGIEMAKELGLI
jgi:hypothetical protein